MQPCSLRNQTCWTVALRCWLTHDTVQLLQVHLTGSGPALEPERSVASSSTLPRLTQHPRHLLKMRKASTAKRRSHSAERIPGHLTASIRYRISCQILHKMAHKSEVSHWEQSITNFPSHNRGVWQFWDLLSCECKLLVCNSPDAPSSLYS